MMSLQRVVVQLGQCAADFLYFSVDSHWVEPLGKQQLAGKTSEKNPSSSVGNTREKALFLSFFFSPTCIPQKRESDGRSEGYSYQAIRADGPVWCESRASVSWVEGKE